MGVVGSVGAEEVTNTPSPSMGTLSTFQTKSIITPYNMQKFYSEYKYYPKSQYPMSGQVPFSYFKTTSDGYSGTLTRQWVKAWGTNGDYWQAYYSGTLTKFE